MQVLIADWAVGRALRLNDRREEAQPLPTAVLERAQARRETQDSPLNREWTGYAQWELGELHAARGERQAAPARLGAALVDLEAAGLGERWPEGLERLRALIEAWGGDQAETA